MRNPFSLRLILALLLATTGPLLFGYHLAELNAPQAVLTCQGYDESRLRPHARFLFLDLPQCIPMSELETGLTTSLFTLGGLLGAVAAGPLSSAAGRLRAMLYTTIPFAAGGALEALASSVAGLSLGRLVSGLGAGAAVVVAPIYVSDIAPPGGWRGAFGAGTQVMINLGIFLAQLLGLFLSHGQLWRVVLGAGGAVGLLQAIGLLAAGIESPKWLAENGRPQEARAALGKLRLVGADLDAELRVWSAGGAGDDDDDDDDEEEVGERQALLSGGGGGGGGSAHRHRRHGSGRYGIGHANGNIHSGNAGHGDDDSHGDGSNGNHDGEAAAAAAAHPTHRSKRSASPAARQVGFFAVLAHPAYRRATLVVTVVMMAQQLCGINSIVFYGVSLLHDLLDASAALLNVVVALVSLAVTLACAPLIERLGRRACLVASTAGMGASALLLATAIAVARAPALSVVSVVTFVSSFGLGLGAIPFMLASELVGPEAVGAAQSWALTANWVSTFAVAQFFPVANKALGPGRVYFVFAGIAAASAAFVVAFVPETKGRRDAEEVWGSGDGDGAAAAAAEEEERRRKQQQQQQQQQQQNDEDQQFQKRRKQGLTAGT